MVTAGVRRSRVFRALLGVAAVCWAASAQANLPLGACCLPNDVCQDLMSTQCDGAGGEFIGEGTACSATRCDTPSAPVASVFGLIALGGALAAFGIRRLLR